MTTLYQISEAQSAKATAANENFTAVAAAGLFGYNFQETSGLAFGYYGGILHVDGVQTSIADGSTTIADGTTSYIECSRAGVVSNNTTGFTAGRIPLWTATTFGGAITVKVDYRVFLDPPHVGSFLSKAFPSDANVTLTAAEARARVIRMTGALGGTRNVVVPLNGEWIFHNNTTGSPLSSIQIIGSSGTGVTIANGMTAMVYGDGSNIYRVTADASQ